MVKKTQISIHALTGSATYMRMWIDNQEIVISIHALTGSATMVWSSANSSMFIFQSTHSRGVRLEDATIAANTTKISIHALTGSATQS